VIDQQNLPTSSDETDHDFARAFMYRGGLNAAH
jgi:hypothetical protein